MNKLLLAKRNRRYRLESIKKGICVVYGCKNVPTDGKRRCKYHRTRLNTQERVARMNRIAEGKCRVAKCENTPHANQKTCYFHFTQFARYYRKRFYGYTEAQEQRYQDALIGKGTCDFCGFPFIEGRTPHQDHDHACCPDSKTCGNCLRGLVHSECNRCALVYAEWLEATFGVLDPKLAAYRAKFQKT